MPELNLQGLEERLGSVLGQLETIDKSNREAIDAAAKEAAKNFVARQDFIVAQEALSKIEERQGAILDSIDKRFNEPQRVGLGGEKDEKREQVKRHRAAFADMIRQGAPNLLQLKGDAQQYFTGDEYREISARIEKRTLSETVPTDGGYLVPEDIQSEVIEPVVNMSPMRQIADIDTTTGNSYVTHDLTGWPTAGWVGELGAQANSQPTFGEKRIPIFKASVSIPCSQELLEDAVNLEERLARYAAIQIEALEGAAFVDGTGVNQPTGFVTRLLALESAGSAGDYVITGADDANNEIHEDDFKTLLYGNSISSGLHEKYRRNATWVMNSQSIADVLKLKNSNNDYIWQRDIREGVPLSIEGRPIVALEDMDNGGTNTNRPLAVGDFRAGYRIVDRSGYRVLRDPYSSASSDTVVYYWFKRVGGDVVLPEAIRVLEV